MVNVNYIVYNITLENPNYTLYNHRYNLIHTILATLLGNVWLMAIKAYSALHECCAVNNRRSFGPSLDCSMQCKSYCELLNFLFYFERQGYRTIFWNADTETDTSNLECQLFRILLCTPISQNKQNCNAVLYFYQF